MAKRIFTKVFSGTIGTDGAQAVTHNAIDSWLLQENIEVIGAEVLAACTTRSQNDGESHLALELSQQGIFGMDGVILKAVATEGWNTAPQGIEKCSGHAFLAFPQGFAVPVREEGYLYVNGSTFGKTAGESIYSYAVIVYYTKGSR